MSITLKKPAGATAAPKDAKPTKASQDTRGAKVRAKLKQSGIATAKALWRTLIVLAPFLLPLGLALTLSEGTDRWPAALEYVLDHIALVFIPLIPTLYGVIYVIRNYQRTHPPKNKNGRPVRPAEPAQPSLSQRTKDAADIIGNLDSIPWRAAMIGGFLAATLTAGVFLPVSVDDFAAAGTTITSDPTGTVMDLLGPLVLILAAYGLIFARVASIVKGRADELGQIYAVARDTLGYPKRKPASPTKRQQTLLVPHLAIDVKKWRSLENVDTFFVTAPEELSVEDLDKWDSFDVNLNAKVPRSEEWRVQRDPRGRGATVGAANYPTGILWDGEIDPDPLTFIVGENLETGKKHKITFNDTSPHSAVSGGTSSGKALPLSTLVPTPLGMRRVGDLAVGDYVLTPSGMPAPISGMSPVRVPEEAWRLIFSDGTSQVASGDHRWTTWNRAARRAAGRQRRLGSTRERRRLLTEHQVMVLRAVAAQAENGDDIDLEEVRALVGMKRGGPADAALMEIAMGLGHSRERRWETTFVYPEQVVTQKQTMYVMDRTELHLLSARMETSSSQRLRDYAPAVRTLSTMGDPVVTTREINTSMPDMARSDVLAILRRAGVTSLRKEKRAVTLNVPAKTLTRIGPAAAFHYPKRPLLEAFAARGEAAANDQRHLMATPKVRTTREIVDTLRYRAAGAGEDAASWANHSVPAAAPSQLPERDLPVDPYVLGAWLGDGTSTGGGITSVDPEILENITAAGYEVGHHPTVGQAHYIRGLVPALRALGVLGNKHIPQEYLFASVEQRLALLQGLMDTDGSVARDTGNCEFYQSDHAFAQQVRSLVASLGMIAHLRSRPSGYRDNVTGQRVECKEAWTVTFGPRMQVFRLSRKACLIDPDQYRSKSEHRYIVAVEPVEPVEMRCLMVNDDNHEFLVGDQFLPTHNTSYAEIIAAQMLIKPMPWDPDLYGRVVIVDPKGPFGRRWAGRPGVVVANGQDDAAELDDEGEAITGPMVMAAALEWVEEEHQRRAKILAQYPDAATWMHLPDSVKKAERFAPICVILDEYIDHTDDEQSKEGDERVEKENAARHITTRLANWQARKYRNVGMHTILIAQEVKMTLIGSTLMRNLPVRVVTGQMDRTQLQTMFAVDDPTSIPSLPSTRVVYKDGERELKTIPGRARIMNALGQTINKIQVMYFGGPTNSETLDKWLPRGPKPPNGDFSFPKGRPRRPEDFDANGEYIGDPKDATYEQGPDLPMDETEPSAADIIAEDDFGQDPRPAEEGGADEEFIDEAPGVNLDKDAVFPAAQAQAPRCDHPGCVNDADRQCPGCESRRCGQHVGPHPDPAQSVLVCSRCRGKEPLVRFGVEDLYRDLYSLSRRGGLLPSYQVAVDEDEDDGSLVMTAWTPKKQKVVEVTATAGGLTARSRAGTVTGDGVHDIVEETLTAYIRLREQPTPAAEDDTEDDAENEDEEVGS